MVWKIKVWIYFHYQRICKNGAGPVWAHICICHPLSWFSVLSSYFNIFKNPLFNSSLLVLSISVVKKKNSTADSGWKIPMPDTVCSHESLLREGWVSLANILGSLITEDWQDWQHIWGLWRCRRPQGLLMSGVVIQKVFVECMIGATGEEKLLGCSVMLGEWLIILLFAQEACRVFYNYHIACLSSQTPPCYLHCVCWPVMVFLDRSSWFLNSH